MLPIVVIGRDGIEQAMTVAADCALMESLREANTGIEGTCGGAMSCGTCHVYIDEAWADKLSPRSEDELAMLEAIGDFVPLKPGSRLSCQIEMKAGLAGLKLEIAKEI